MNIDLIKTKFNALRELYEARSPSDQLLGRVDLVYAQHIITKLKKIIPEDCPANEVSVEKLALMLEDNRNLVQGSRLDYTASPTGDITLLLCTIAEYVAEHQNVRAINVLMPGIACDSICPHLYPNLDEVSLRKVLRTHILSDDQNCLIPVLLLARPNIQDPFEPVCNPYFDVYEHKESSVHLSDKELMRLSAHSDTTAAIGSAVSDYKLLWKDNTTLLGKIHELNNAFRYNSVQGIGTEDHAGTDTYVAIVKFIAYYKKEVDPSTIPSPVVDAIEQIIAFSSDHKVRTAHTATMATCITTLRLNLLKAMQDHESELEKIKPSTEQTQSQITKITQDIKNYTACLEKHLAEDTYLGYDRRGITTKTMSELQFDVKFDDFQTLTEALQGISAEDVSAICALHNAPAEIVYAIADVANLVILAIEKLNEDVLQALLYGVGDKIKSIIDTSESFSTLLILLNPAQRTAVFEALKNQLPSLIKDDYDFALILQYLSPKQCRDVCKSLKKLSSFFDCGTDFALKVLQPLTPEQRVAVYATLKDQLPPLIKSIQDFAKILSLLDPIQFTTFCSALQNKFPTLTTHGSDLSLFLHLLTPEQRTAVCEALKNQLPSLIKDRYDFALILQYLSPKQCRDVCKSLKKLSSFFDCGTDFALKVLQPLTPEQRVAVYATLKDQLPPLIESIQDFAKILSLLDPIQCTTFYNALQNKFPTLITHGSDLSLFLHLLTPEQCTNVCEASKRMIFSSTHPIDLIGVILEKLNLAQRTAVYESIKNQLPSIIIHRTDFFKVCENLTQEQSAEVQMAVINGRDTRRRNRELQQHGMFTPNLTNEGSHNTPSHHPHPKP